MSRMLYVISIPLSPDATHVVGLVSRLACLVRRTPLLFRDDKLPHPPPLMCGLHVAFSFLPFGLQPSAQPKHCYVLDPSCSVSDMKETKAGGRTLFYFELEWPSMASKEEGEDEGESGRCVCVSVLCAVGSFRLFSVRLAPGVSKATIPM